jgi:hypothetical protein
MEIAALAAVAATAPPTMSSVILAAWRTLPPSATATADSMSRSHLLLRLNSPIVCPLSGSPAAIKLVRIR